MRRRSTGKARRSDRRFSRTTLAVAIGSILAPALSPWSAAIAQTVAAAGFTPGSFSASPSGAADYSIPIQVPPGVSGIEPKLALAYDSQAGNGLAGVGWALSGLSVIHRCGTSIVQDGLNAGVIYGANDRFCLDGQRLVAVSTPYGANGTEYRTERESFTRVISYGAAGSGPSYFKVSTKGGQTIEYGNTADSKIEAQGKAEVRIWAANKLSDTKGNFLRISYNEDNANGDYSPARIEYTANDGQALAPFASVQFSYQSRTDVNPVYVGGSVLKTQNRLTNVKTYVGTTLVRDYQLSYTYSSSGLSRLDTLKECAAGIPIPCLPAHSFGWQAPSGTNGAGAASLWAQPGAQPRFGDLNGDGLADMVYVSGGNFMVRYSTGAGFGAATALAAADSGNFAVGDVDGDGKADIVSFLSTGQVNARLSTGSGVGAAGNWGAYSGQAPVTLGDFNGDGKADLVYVSASNYLTLHLSSGAAFGAATTLAAADAGNVCSAVEVDEYGEYGACTAYNTPQVLLADVNGDGRVDVVTLVGTYANVRLSTGTGVAAAGNWGSYDYVLGGVGDLNGDGMADLVYQNAGSLYVKYSNGAQFGGAVLLGSGADITYGLLYGCNEYGSCGAYASSVFFPAADLNGDGHADAVVVGPGNGYGSYVRLATTQTPDLVNGITNSLGLMTTLTYKPFTDATVYAKDNDALWPVRDLQAQGPLYALSQVSVPNLAGGNLVTSYFYRGAKAHMQGGGFLGLRQFEATDAQTLIKTTTTFRQDYPYQGMPTQTVKAQSSGAVLSQTKSTWTDTPLAPAAGSGGKYHKILPAQNEESGNDLNGAALPTVTTSFTYDAYGNATTVNVATGDGYSKATINTYANDAANWFLGRLTRSTVQSTTP